MKPTSPALKRAIKNLRTYERKRFWNAGSPKRTRWVTLCANGGSIIISPLDLSSPEVQWTVGHVANLFTRHKYSVWMWPCKAPSTAERIDINKP